MSHGTMKAHVCCFILMDWLFNYLNSLHADFYIVYLMVNNKFLLFYFKLNSHEIESVAWKKTFQEKKKQIPSLNEWRRRFEKQIFVKWDVLGYQYHRLYQYIVRCDSFFFSNIFINRRTAHYDIAVVKFNINVDIKFSAHDTFLE